MYKLGFCVYGPQCRYKHTRLPAPAPPPESIEAAKPREFRDPNKVVNFVNPGARPRPQADLSVCLRFIMLYSATAVQVIALNPFCQGQAHGVPPGRTVDQLSRASCGRACAAYSG